MWLEGQVDQLEDRYLGMVEAGGSNPPLSTFHLAFIENFLFRKNGSLVILVVFVHSIGQILTI